MKFFSIALVVVFSLMLVSNAVSAVAPVDKILQCTSFSGNSAPFTCEISAGTVANFQNPNEGDVFKFSSVFDNAGNAVPSSSVNLVIRTTSVNFPESVRVIFFGFNNVNFIYSNFTIPSNADTISRLDFEESPVRFDNSNLSLGIFSVNSKGFAASKSNFSVIVFASSLFGSATFIDSIVGIKQTGGFLSGLFQTNFIVWGRDPTSSIYFERGMINASYFALINAGEVEMHTPVNTFSDSWNFVPEFTAALGVEPGDFVVVGDGIILGSVVNATRNSRFASTSSIFLTGDIYSNGNLTAKAIGNFQQDLSSSVSVSNGSITLVGGTGRIFGELIAANHFYLLGVLPTLKVDDHTFRASGINLFFTDLTVGDRAYLATRPNLKTISIGIPGRLTVASFLFTVGNQITLNASNSLQVIDRAQIRSSDGVSFKAPRLTVGNQIILVADGSADPAYPGDKFIQLITCNGAGIAPQFAQFHVQDLCPAAKLVNVYGYFASVRAVPYTVGSAKVTEVRGPNGVVKLPDGSVENWQATFNGIFLDGGFFKFTLGSDTADNPKLQIQPGDYNVKITFSNRATFSCTADGDVCEEKVVPARVS